MISFLALSGMAAYGLGGIVTETQDTTAKKTNALRYSANPIGSETGFPGFDLAEGAGVFDFARGDLITGFDPAYDILELEYAAAMGRPEVTVINFPDGTGASIALNGVVVADVEGAQGLDPRRVILQPV